MAMKKWIRSWQVRFWDLQEPGECCKENGGPGSLDKRLVVHGFLAQLPNY